MRKSASRQFVLSLIVFFGIAGLALSILADTQDWSAILVPASLNRDTTVKLVGGHTQILVLALQAKEAIRKQDAERDIKLEWDFPQDMRLISNDGVFKQLAFESHQASSRAFFSYVFRVSSANLLGNPGERIKSDWQHQSFFVSVPAEISKESAYISLTLHDGGRVYNWRWPLQIAPLNPAKTRPKMTTIGLWDYGFYRAGAASDGIAAFFQDVGINFIQRASDQPFFEALRKKNILTGGYTHHSAFALEETKNFKAGGEALPRNFACPQASLELSRKLPITGVESLAKNALKANNMAVFDYEPTGMAGFCEQAISKFKEEYKVDASKFELFRRYFSFNKFKTYLSKDPEIKAIYEKWKRFNSQQTGSYIRQIRQALRKDHPEIRLGVTTGKSYGMNPESVAALGNDNSTLADGADIIMPQLYFGYNGANVKLLMKYTQGWRETLEARKLKTQLWPLLLIRYPGLNQDQPPLRFRQQVLGALAAGAQGVVIYAPSNMEADHWIALADTMKDIVAYEDFYQRGLRVDGIFGLQQMPKNQVTQNVWPDYKEIVEGPGWAFTAHEWQDKYLLTFFNLEESGDIDFKFDSLPKTRLIKTDGVTKKNEFEWTVRAGQIGFVIFSKS